MSVGLLKKATYFNPSEHLYMLGTRDAIKKGSRGLEP